MFRDEWKESPRRTKCVVTRRVDESNLCFLYLDVSSCPICPVRVCASNRPPSPECNASRNQSPRKLVTSPIRGTPSNSKPPCLRIACCREPSEFRHLLSVERRSDARHCLIGHPRTARGISNPSRHSVEVTKGTHISHDVEQVRIFHVDGNVVYPRLGPLTPPLACKIRLVSEEGQVKGTKRTDQALFENNTSGGQQCFESPRPAVPVPGIFHQYWSR